MDARSYDHCAACILQPSFVGFTVSYSTRFCGATQQSSSNISCKHSLLICKVPDLPLMATSYFADISTPLTQPYEASISALHALCLRSWLAIWTVSLGLIVSSRRYAGFSAAIDVSRAALLDCNNSLNALRSLTQPCRTAYCPNHSTYDPCISPGFANQCILGDMYLRSNLSRELAMRCK